MTDRATSGHDTRHVAWLPLGRGRIGRLDVAIYLKSLSSQQTLLPRRRRPGTLRSAQSSGCKQVLFPEQRFFSDLNFQKKALFVTSSCPLVNLYGARISVCWNVWELWVTTDRVMSEAKKSWLVLVSIIFCHVVLIFHVTHLCSIITDLKHETLDLH